MIAVQGNDRVETVLPQIQKIGGMIQHLGDRRSGRGGCAGFRFAHPGVQGFTSDPTKISVALKEIQPGSSQNRMIDAVEEVRAHVCAAALKEPPPDHHVGQRNARRSSEAHLKETLIEVQLANVDVYTVDISRFVTSLMAKPDPGYIDNRPPAMTPHAVQASRQLPTQSCRLPAASVAAPNLSR